MVGGVFSNCQSGNADAPHHARENCQRPDGPRPVAFHPEHRRLRSYFTYSNFYIHRINTHLLLKRGFSQSLKMY